MAQTPKLQICTWLYGDAPGEESQYLQVGGAQSSTPAFQAVYWRCVALYFAISARVNPDAEHVLFTNFERVPSVDGLGLPALLGELGVQVTPVPFTYQPPPGYYGSWRNQFYVFDVLQHLTRTLAPADVAVVLDSDCFWLRPAAQLAADVRRHGLLTYAVAEENAAADVPINGLTRNEMRQVFEELSGQAVPEPPLYFGGEFYAATGAATARVVAAWEALWPELLRRHAEGRLKFNEEAHALSYLYWALGYPAGTADAYIKRIWTVLFRLHNARPEDAARTIWHVPAEKRYGIRRLFDDLKDRRSPLWTLPPGPGLAAYLGRRLGIPRRSPVKLVQDLGVAIPYKLRQKLQGA